MKNLQKGYSLMELLIVVVILGIFISFAIATFGGPDIDCKDKSPTRLPTLGNPCPSCSFVVRAKIANAIGRLGEVNLKVQMFELRTGRYPTSMDELKLSDSNDPWGNPYVFLNHADVNGNGKKRKNRSMVPVNSYFDIYSKGPDGKSATPFTSIPGGDDIVIANNGQYVGVACFYYTKK